MSKILRMVRGTERPWFPLQYVNLRKWKLLLFMIIIIVIFMTL